MEDFYGRRHGLHDTDAPLCREVIPLNSWCSLCLCAGFMPTCCKMIQPFQSCGENTILPKADMNEIGDASHPNCLRVRAQPGHLRVFAGYFPSCICHMANLSGPTSLLLSNHVVTPMSVVNMEFNYPCL